MIVDGTPISANGAEALVDLLLRDRSAAALSAAAAVEIALERNIETVNLSPASRCALVSALETAWRTGHPTAN